MYIYCTVSAPQDQDRSLSNRLESKGEHGLQKRKHRDLAQAPIAA